MRKDSNPYIVDETIDAKLKSCNQDILMTFHLQTNSELRISLYFAVILAELTEGVVFDPQEDRYLTGEQASSTLGAEVTEYENSTKAEEFVLEEFDGWN